MSTFYKIEDSMIVTSVSRLFYKGITIICCLFLFTHTTWSQNMEKHLWKNRVILIDCATAAEAKCQLQLQEFVNEKEALDDRKIVIYMKKDTQYHILHQPKIMELVSSNKASNSASNSTIEMTLIGLDGGIKLHQTDWISKEQLYQLIDSMPMRQSELQSRNR